MTLESLRLLRNILLRSVVIGIGFTLLLALFTFGAWDWWISWAVPLLRTDEAHISSMVLTLFTEIRFFIVFVLLTPGLAIHWTIKKELARKQATAQSLSEKENQTFGKGDVVGQH